MIMRRRSWGRVSEVRLYWDIENVPGEGLDEDSTQMIRTMPAIYQTARKGLLFDSYFLFLFGVNLVVQQLPEVLLRYWVFNWQMMSL